MVSKNINTKNNKLQLEHQKKWFNKHYREFKGYNLENWRKSTLIRLFSSLKIDKGSKKNNSLYIDIGVGGSGYTVIEAAKLGQKAVGVDISFEGVKKAYEFSKSQQLSSKCLFVVCSADALPFKTETFSNISAISVLEHLYNDILCAKEIVRITKNNALIYITVPNTYYRMWPFLWPFYYFIDKNIGHLRHYSEEKLENIFVKEKLSLESISYNGHLIKLVQLVLEKLIGSNRFPEALWWKMESIDTNSRVKSGLQLTTVFKKL